MSNVIRFTEIDESLADDLAERFGSPFYLLDELGIRARLEELQREAREVYPASRIAISYKTNPTRCLLDDLHKTGAFAEVVSGDEFQMARSLGIPASEIVFNGPLKTDSELAAAIRGGSYIHCDHDDELDRVEAIARQMQRVVSLGIRLYFPGQDNWQRFGFRADENEPDCHALKTVRRIVDSRYLNITGFHAHIGTNVREIDRFAEFARAYRDFVGHVVRSNKIDLKWIDVGGGLAGMAPLVAEKRRTPHPLPSLSAYCRAVIEPFLPLLEEARSQSGNQPMLLMEPGRTLFNAFGGMFVTVVGRRPAGPDGVSSVILDAGITSMHFAHKYDLPVHACQTSESPRSVRLLGPTCMEQDVVCRPTLLPELRPGDHLIVYATGCYSMAMASSFIRMKPGTVGWGVDQQFRWLRMPESVEHSARLDFIPANKVPTQRRSA